MEHAANIINAVRVLEAAGEEIDALGNELGKMLTELGKAAPVAFKEDDENIEYDEYAPGGGWICNGTRWNFPAKKQKEGKGPKPAAGALTVVADLGGEGRPAQAVGFPCLIVAWCGPDEDWGEEIDDGDFWPRTSDTDDLQDERLFRYVEEEDQADRGGPNIEASWFYIVPLLAITGTDKLRSLVVNPVRRLLDGEPPARAFRDAPEVLRFGWQHNEPRLITPGAA